MKKVSSYIKIDAKVLHKPDANALIFMNVNKSTEMAG